MCLENEHPASVSLQVAAMDGKVIAYKVFYQEYEDEGGKLTSLMGRGNGTQFNYTPQNADKDGWFEAPDCENIELQTEFSKRQDGFYVFRERQDAYEYLNGEFDGRLKHHLVLLPVLIDKVFVEGVMWVSSFRFMVPAEGRPAYRCKKLKILTEEEAEKCMSAMTV